MTIDTIANVVCSVLILICVVLLMWASHLGQQNTEKLDDILRRFIEERRSGPNPEE